MLPTEPRTLKLVVAGLALVLSSVLGKDVFIRIAEVINATAAAMLP